MYCILSNLKLNNLKLKLFFTLRSRIMWMTWIFPPFPVSPDGLLQQSSTVADSVSFQFSDGITESVPCSYIEFAERFVLPQYENLPHTEVSSILSFKYHVLAFYCNSHLWFLWMRLDVCNHWSVFQFRTKLWTTLRIWMICMFGLMVGLVESRWLTVIFATLELLRITVPQWFCRIHCQSKHTLSHFLLDC